MINTQRSSIVTPAYNSERFIGETIESVVSQAGNFSIEYFIMDDGSADDTGEIMQGYQKLLLENSYPFQCNKAQAIPIQVGLYAEEARQFQFVWVVEQPEQIKDCLYEITHMEYRQNAVDFFISKFEFNNYQNNLWSRFGMRAPK